MITHQISMQTYLDPTQEQGRAFSTRSIAGSVVMLNPLRFRPTADYSAAPAFYGRGGDFLIGPANERWDAAMLVRQSSVGSFLAFASNRDYLAGIAHRTAALEDSRLLPLIDVQT